MDWQLGDQLYGRCYPPRIVTLVVYLQETTIGDLLVLDSSGHNLRNFSFLSSSGIYTSRIAYLDNLYFVTDGIFWSADFVDLQQISV
jgi:hypothetical protein